MPFRITHILTKNIITFPDITAKKITYFDNDTVEKITIEKTCIAAFKEVPFFKDKNRFHIQSKREKIFFFNWR